MTRDDKRVQTNDLKISNLVSLFQIEDQDGNIIYIPPEEKKAIMMALAIHEKGRAALRRNAYNEALLFLLEADNEYRICNSQLLSTVDNYALLNLDIVWCYIMLKVFELDKSNYMMFDEFCVESIQNSHAK